MTDSVLFLLSTQHHCADARRGNETIYMEIVAIFTLAVHIKGRTKDLLGFFPIVGEQSPAYLSEEDNR
ncbi:hypothetical protein JAO29_04555 [Edaphobacter sp. HDX4]|uniref:hypothetical protein n=1 Tax=Edaphobacter sp. HDX4 TaxID=2794064 RepID=UPI002FE5FC9D